MAQVVLADEINRATPKAQAALLEAMEERQITVDGVTHPLPHPFMVLATRNPIEYRGTFPLPEGQLDRFLLRVRLGYPEQEEEVNVLDRQQYFHPLQKLEQVASLEELTQAQETIKAVHVSPAVKDYIVELVRRTREHPDVDLGASPRGSLALYRAGQARAAIDGRDFVLPDDVKGLAAPALAHRLIVGPTTHLRDQAAERILHEILAKLPVPGRERAGRR
jgi:MoxR-like ATPase